MLPRDLRQYTNRKVFIALGAIIGLAFVTTAATTLALSALLVYRQGAQSYNDSRVELESLRSSIQRSAALERQYLLEPNAASLQAYHQVVVDLAQTLSRIEGEATPSSLVPRVNQLRPLIGQLTSEQNRVMASPGSSALDTAAESDITGQLNSLIADIQASDSAQLQSNQTRITSLSHLALTISLGSLGLTLLLAVLIYYLYLKDIQSEHRLNRAKDEFVSLASHQHHTRDRSQDNISYPRFGRRGTAKPTPALLCHQSTRIQRSRPPGNRRAA
jgi:CHASE3 domain sensor protein